MIAFLRGNIVSKGDWGMILETHGVGYEVFCSPQSLSSVGNVGDHCELFIHTHYKADGAALFGFNVPQEKGLFLSLIKVDSVGPKSALKILSAAPWNEIVRKIEEGDVQGLSQLPKITKKVAEHLVVKLKGKLGDLDIIEDASGEALSSSRSQEIRNLRSEAATALAHLGFKLQDVEKTLRDLDDSTWQSDLQTVIRTALNSLTGNI